MNNNRNNANNRRRGRGNRNQGGGSQGNRIDSRARGNAPQLLDKYKKLAEDAHRNGDRVQAEYYLQFADHYFRVLADNRARQDEQRGGAGEQRGNWRRDERDSDEFEMGDEDEGGEDSRRSDEREPRREGREDRGNREGRRERPRRDDNRGSRAQQQVSADNGIAEGSEGDAYEPDENPFTRDARASRTPREPREDRPRRPRQRNRREDEGAGESIDASILPPAFSANDSGVANGADEGAEAAPRPRRKRGDGDTLSAVG